MHEDDPDWWAVNALMDLGHNDPPRALDIVFIISRDSDNEWVLENLGAGPLEELIGDDPALLDRIEREIGSNPRLRLALRAVWQGEMSDDIWARLQRSARVA
jgi:hypothetical protein